MPDHPRANDESESDRAAASSRMDSLLPLVYDELRAIARNAMKLEGGLHTLQPTAVVNEAYLRLRSQRNLDVGNRSQFFALAVTMIRRVLVDHARAKHAGKRRGTGKRVKLRDVTLSEDPREGAVDLLTLEDALERLEKLSERSVRIVELRFFAGLSVDEVAAEMNMSARAVAAEWAFARAWLRRELGR